MSSERHLLLLPTVPMASLRISPEGTPPVSGKYTGKAAMGDTVQKVRTIRSKGPWVVAVFMEKSGPYPQFGPTGRSGRHADPAENLGAFSPSGKIRAGRTLGNSPSSFSRKVLHFSAFQNSASVIIYYKKMSYIIPCGFIRVHQKIYADPADL